MSSVYKSAAGKALLLEKYQQFLHRWTVPFQRVEVPTRQGQTSVIVCGDESKQPLILLHGSMSNSLMWTKDIESWSQHFRVLAVDIIGEAGFSSEARPDLHSGDYAAWLDDVLDYFEIEAASLTGISLGGWLALDFAIRRPARVARAVLMCPAGIGRQKRSFLYKALLLMMLGKWGKGKLRKMIAGDLVQSDDTGAQHYLNYLSLVQEHFRPRIARFGIVSSDSIARISSPTLVIAGGRDVFFDFRDAGQRLQNSNRNFTVIFDEKLGHMIVGQTKVIERFLLAG